MSKVLPFPRHSSEVQFLGIFQNKKNEVFLKIVNNKVNILPDNRELNKIPRQLYFTPSLLISLLQTYKVGGFAYTSCAAYGWNSNKLKTLDKRLLRTFAAKEKLQSQRHSNVRKASLVKRFPQRIAWQRQPCRKISSRMFVGVLNLLKSSHESFCLFVVAVCFQKWIIDRETFLFTIKVEIYKKISNSGGLLMNRSSWKAFHEIVRRSAMRRGGGIIERRITLWPRWNI